MNTSVQASAMNEVQHMPAPSESLLRPPGRIVNAVLAKKMRDGIGEPHRAEGCRAHSKCANARNDVDAAKEEASRPSPIPKGMATTTRKPCPHPIGCPSPLNPVGTSSSPRASGVESPHITDGIQNYFVAMIEFGMHMDAACTPALPS